jgi:hypothetical protein
MITGILAHYSNVKLDALLSGGFGAEAKAAADSLVDDAFKVNGWRGDFVTSHFGHVAVWKLHRAIEIERESTRTIDITGKFQ